MATKPARTGFTLLELTLVMAIIVMTAAISYPLAESGYVHFKLTGATDAVKGAWAQARARAIEDGVPYRFSVVKGGRHFRVAPDQAEYWGGSDPEPQDKDHPPLILQGTLPKGVPFSLNGDKGNPSSRDMDDKAAIDPGSWSKAAVFLPTGSADDDVEISFEMPGAKPVKLQLRALTGTVKTVKHQSGEGGRENDRNHQDRDR